MYKVLYIGSDEYLLPSTQNNINHIIVDKCDCSLDGLISLRNNQYDLVLLDINLRRINAFECLNIIRRNPHYHHLKIGLLSNYHKPHIVDEYYKYGIDFFFNKPLDNISLERALKEIHNTQNTTISRIFV